MTGTFEGRLELYELAGHNGRWFCLMSALVFIDVDGTRHTAPAGTLTDFASVPQWLWSLVPNLGRQNRASVVHDYYCKEKTLPSPTVHALFRRMLKACECSWLTVWGFWLCVRLFGPRFTGQ